MSVLNILKHDRFSGLQKYVHI